MAWGNAVFFFSHPPPHVTRLRRSASAQPGTIVRGRCNPEEDSAPCTCTSQVVPDDGTIFGRERNQNMRGHGTDSHHLPQSSPGGERRRCATPLPAWPTSCESGIATHDAHKGGGGESAVADPEWFARWHRRCAATLAWHAAPTKLSAISLSPPLVHLQAPLKSSLCSLSCTARMQHSKICR